MKYSEELTAEICKYIRAGNNYEDSVGLAGIGESTFYDWKKEKPEFVEALKKAERECKARNIAIILKAGETSWQASAWWLERKYSNEFALKQVQELTGKDGGPINVKLIRDYLSEPVTNASPTGSVKGQDEVQGISLAQEGKENINSTGEDSTGGVQPAP